MSIRQEVRRSHAALRCALFFLCDTLALWVLAYPLGGGPVCFVPLPFLLFAAVLYCFPAYTYVFDGEQLEIWSGGLYPARLLARVPVEAIFSYGTYLPGQLSARDAGRVLRAVLPLSPEARHYFLYRTEDGGTGLVVFSPNDALQAVFVRDSWIYQPS